MSRVAITGGTEKMISWRRRSLQYKTLGVAVLAQALLFIVLIWIFSPTLPPVSFFNSAAMLPVLIVTALPISWLAEVVFVRSGDSIDGAILLGAGILAGCLAQGEWIVNIVLLAFAFWGILIGFLVLCNRISHFVFGRFGW